MLVLLVFFSLFVFVIIMCTYLVMELDGFFFFLVSFVCFEIIMCSIENNGVRCFSLRLASAGNSWL